MNRVEHESTSRFWKRFITSAYVIEAVTSLILMCAWMTAPVALTDVSFFDMLLLPMIGEVVRLGMFLATFYDSGPHPFHQAIGHVAVHWCTSTIVSLYAVTLANLPGPSAQWQPAVTRVALVVIITWLLVANAVLMLLLLPFSWFTLKNDSGGQPPDSSGPVPVSSTGPAPGVPGQPRIDPTLREYELDLRLSEDGSGLQGSACTVCLMEFAQGDVVKELTCHHVFHTECIDRWLSQAAGPCLCPMRCAVALGRAQIEHLEVPI